MCDIKPVVAWLIAAAVAIGGAVSSVIFGIVYPFWYTGALLAAAGWCVAALAFALAASDALNKFCTCASSSSACAGPCSALRTLMELLIATMLASAGLCGVAATQGWNPWFGVVFGFDAVWLSGLVFDIIYQVINLGSCIARSTPPDGTGAPPI